MKLPRALLQQPAWKINSQLATLDPEIQVPRGPTRRVQLALDHRDIYTVSRTRHCRSHFLACFALGGKRTSEGNAAASIRRMCTVRRLVERAAKSLRIAGAYFFITRMLKEETRGDNRGIWKHLSGTSRDVTGESTNAEERPGKHARGINRENCC